MGDNFFEQILGCLTLIVIGTAMGGALALGVFVIGYLTTLIPVVY